MLDQNTFTETIREVSEIIRTSAEPLTRDEILGYFNDMELSAEQENMVLEFLLTPHDEPVTEPETSDDENADSQSGADTEEYQDTDSAEMVNSDNKKEQTKQDCIPDSKMFQMFLEELEELPEYSDEKLEELYQELLSGKEAAISAITTGWMRKVLEIAKGLADSPEGFEDVVQEGNMGLFLKLSELCGSQEKVDVKDELEQAVIQSMKQCISEFAGEGDSENAMIGKINLVNEARKYLAEKSGMEPTAKELADYTKMPEEELSDIMDIIQKASQKK